MVFINELLISLFIIILCKYLIFLNLIAANTLSPDPFDLGGIAETLPTSTGAIKKTPQSFLGENSALVNLDNLVSSSAIKSTTPTPAGNYLF